MREKDDREAEDPVSSLAGSSLRVYILLLSSDRPLGVREVQRRIGFKSPSTARHHLERLVDLGLAYKTGGGYMAKRPREGFLAAYIIFKGRILPRSIIPAAFSVGASTVYSILPGSDPVASVVMWVMSLLFIGETYLTWRSVKKLVQPLVQA